MQPAHAAKKFKADVLSRLRIVAAADPVRVVRLISAQLTGLSGTRHRTVVVWLARSRTNAIIAWLMARPKMHAMHYRTATQEIDPGLSC
jgi:hypothetical protein